ncbi:alpha/beta hydrolase [Priestia megaterium]|uniref:Alpha/beta hydrolase family protein n=1 Tax=Priestia megaterium (strain ATCC 14581 / DSM 32 / CCUG 1817 / JCM 2506 / NBRC 15308 / NCIMB 9376 / NCTC 10342 / NRRL B-14308 / VKM B-512 / Ford 19) TaxID=1348623 RepID=A0A0B6AUN3_PRIM2|nr:MULTISPECIES: alpha/beta hydrolase [Priestia]AJI23564.1 alpha/beta hydrolase family protein [Priestia megaterium NBRC 15308 = ATCC 14581]KGJ81190.1 alpha/beta hydrolase [Priestia megaterium NBRC 15308 = ATCC 14581]MCU7709582.1 alpha/beta hydrolase [Priestia megaterium]MCW1047130.1 alpha/beta hydrolase [Priestia sp. JV24]MDQ0806248.1 pimeloyl-ACP methyl ester carboxylesterase [Priestia megaterium]
MKKDLEREELVDIGSFQVYTKIFGRDEGSPTVIMDAGYGDYSKAWTEIAPSIAKCTRVLIYDRAGLGKSTISSNKRVSSEMVKELRMLLGKLHLTPPYILVGHSFGGVNVRLYTSLYPNEVAGLILVDSTPEDYRQRFLPIMPLEFQEAYNKQFIHEGTYDQFMESLEQVKIHRKKLIDTPVIILAAGKKAFYSPEAQALWLRMQEELLDLSTCSSLVIAPNSGHYIQRDEPDYVINAIERILQNS